MLRKIFRKAYILLYTVGFFASLTIIVFLLINNSHDLRESQQSISSDIPIKWYVHPSDEMGLSVQYPADWIGKEIEGGGILLFSPDFETDEYTTAVINGMSVTITESSRETYPEDLTQLSSQWNEVHGSELLMKPVSSSVRVEVSQLEGTKISFEDGMGVFIPHNDNMYIFDCFFSVQKSRDALPLCEIILQTIEFTTS